MNPSQRHVIAVTTAPRNNFKTSPDESMFFILILYYGFFQLLPKF